MLVELLVHVVHCWFREPMVFPKPEVVIGYMGFGAATTLWLVKPHFKFIFQRGVRLIWVPRWGYFAKPWVLCAHWFWVQLIYSGFGFVVLLGYDFGLVKRATVGLTLVYLGHFFFF